jgi:hypothetical protein
VRAFAFSPSTPILFLLILLLSKKENMLLSRMKVVTSLMVIVCLFGFFAINFRRVVPKVAEA